MARVLVTVSIPDPLTRAELETWLEWSAAQLAALHLRSPLPQGLRVAWPEYAHAKHEAYGYGCNRLRADIPLAAQITLMDEILALIPLCPDANLRRIIHLRIQVTPVALRRVNSWQKIAKTMHTDPRRAARLYVQGMEQILLRVSCEKISTVRHSFDLHAK